MSDNQVPTPLSAEGMEKLQSAASRLIVVQNEVLGMPQAQQEWFFGKEGHSDAFDLAWWINIELPKLRAQFDAKDLRIAELEAQIENPELEVWLCPVHKKLDETNSIRPMDNCVVCIRNQRDRLLDEREAILSKLPPDSPCKHAETGHSVADDVADLVRELDMLLGKPDAVHLGAQAAVTALRQCQAIQAQLAASEAARKKAEEGLAQWEAKYADGEPIGNKVLAVIQELDALRTGLEAAANAFGAAGSIAEKLYGRVRSFIDESVPGWIRGDDGPAYPLLNLSQFCNRSGSAARALLQENPATDNPGQALRDRMDQNSKFVEQMPDWVKGSPVNARPVERPIQVGDIVRHVNGNWRRQVVRILPALPDKNLPVMALLSGGYRYPLPELERVEDGKP